MIGSAVKVLIIGQSTDNRNFYQNWQNLTGYRYEYREPVL